MNCELIEIDGELKENSWKQAPVLTDFIQYNPDEGSPATEKTEVRILYSKDCMYVGVRALDSDPDEIKAILARRDSNPPSDWIRIWIDSYHDHLTAFEFAVNPAGVKRDVYWSNDRKSDDNWDAVWNVEISQDRAGWTAEFRIPFSQIRFPEKEFHTWGFQASRIIARKNEISYWCHVPKGVPQFVSLFGDLTGIESIPSPKRLQLFPYTLGKGSLQSIEEDNPFRRGPKLMTNLGLDLKYGLKSSLTLDATFSPDFGQVEADPGQINLTAYETYFSEKRPFFIEGKNILSFPLGSGHLRESLFYSRRIGRSPQRSLSHVKYADIPENTTILWAFKLTGKTAKGLSVGVMEALTEKEQANVITEEGGKSTETVEPVTNYFLGRIEKESRNGRSAVGFIFTAVNRKIEEESLIFLRKAAYSAGFNFRHRWTKNIYEISGFFIGSYVQGSPDAILKTQQSSAHYFQRPDAAHLELDPTRTSLSGYAGNFSFSKIGGEHWLWGIKGLIRTPGFEVNDMGYMRYADWINQRVWISFKEYKPGKLFRDYDFTLSLSNDWDCSFTHLECRTTFRINYRFLNYWNGTLSLSRGSDRLQADYLRGGPAVLLPGNWRFGGSFRTDSRKNFFFSLQETVRIFDDGAKSFSISPGFVLRPSGNIDLNLWSNFNHSYSMLQYVTGVSIEEHTHYIISRIDQTTVSFTLRINYTIAPNLTLQLYSQPFISAGKYREFKEVIDPRAESYKDRWNMFAPYEVFLQNGQYHILTPGMDKEKIIFDNPDFNYRQFRLNLVVRWEYLPGSVLFLVWSNSINDFDEKGVFSLKKDLQGLFKSPSNNVLLLKISYWFNV